MCCHTHGVLVFAYGFYFRPPVTCCEVAAKAMHDTSLFVLTFSGCCKKVNPILCALQQVILLKLVFLNGENAGFLKAVVLSKIQSQNPHLPI